MAGRVSHPQKYKNVGRVLLFAVPDDTPVHKSKGQSPVSANLPSVPVCLNTLTPSPPTKEKTVKTAGALATTEPLLQGTSAKSPGRPPAKPRPRWLRRLIQPLIKIEHPRTQKHKRPKPISRT
ncbi:hypothetical protein OS493_004138 [Desmophyllum pertusum]|uniref:Uncharacterized protein n=1 Tax=Desmophyllum pertusum TaxID=174260 RepID=A0A9W9ZSP2_9CNID|nr:hypothetical protein OS493_004138 [Desmophyllum pertusum]